jgi:hypothetical protein
MSLAKSSAVETQSVQPQIAPPPSGIAGYEWEGVPVDIFRHFQVEMGTMPTKDIEQLRDITKWAKSRTVDEPSIGNVLREVSRVQRELGAPALNERNYSKVWRFIKAQMVIDEMTKRQQSLRSSPWL